MIGTHRAAHQLQLFLQERFSGVVLTDALVGIGQIPKLSQVFRMVVAQRTTADLQRLLEILLALGIFLLSEMQMSQRTEATDDHRVEFPEGGLMEFERMAE